jgi:hypothetical protein
MTRAQARRRERLAWRRVLETMDMPAQVWLSSFKAWLCARAQIMEINANA